jgi:hypothetical protein
VFAERYWQAPASNINSTPQMNDDLLNILSSGNKAIDDQMLFKYLNNQLNEAEKHEFEKTLIDSDLISDAVEGLSTFKDKKNLSLLVQQLNAQLKQQVSKKKSIREKRQLKELPWIYYTIIIIIVILLISFFVIWKHIHG